MKIREINAMRGPNYWSIRRHRLIVMVLDLEEMEELPSNKIDGFADRIREMFPSMYSHRCSEGCEGGFFMRVDEGTWMGPVRRGLRYLQPLGSILGNDIVPDRVITRAAADRLGAGEAGTFRRGALARYSCAA